MGTVEDSVAAGGLVEEVHEVLIGAGTASAMLMKLATSRRKWKMEYIFLIDGIGGPKKTVA